jgi:hypothetical protein
MAAGMSEHIRNVRINTGGTTEHVPEEPVATIDLTAR